MTPEVIAALLGAVVAGVIAVASQLFSGRQARSAAQDDARAARLGEFLAATHAAVLAIGEVAYLPDGEGRGCKGSLRSGSAMQTRRDAVNRSLNVIQLLDDEPIVDAVAELDRSLVRLEDESLAMAWDRDAWRSRRSEVLGGSIDNVYAAGRAALGRDPIDRAQLWSSADRRALDRLGATPTGTPRPPYGS